MTSSDRLSPVLVGLFLALAVAGNEASAPRNLAGRVPRAATAVPAGGPETWCVRDLRSLPGIGTARAEAIVAERWLRGAEEGLAGWGRVPGIGPRTIEGARAAWERLQGARPTPRPYTSRGNESP